MKSITAIADRPARIAALHKMKGDRQIIIDAYYKNCNATPAKTVSAIVYTLGYDDAVIAIAELVNSVSDWDARVYPAVREWAASIEGAADQKEQNSIHIYQPSEIHPAHINQIGQAMKNYTPAEEAQEEAPAEEAQEEAQEENNMDMFNRMTAIVNAHKERSAWGKGVKEYALELVEGLEEYAHYEGRIPATRQECAAWLLNGAKDWKSYSWGGSSLIYDREIAERLCTPSELKRTRNGERRPNSREEWLDTQARALFQASRLVLGAYDAARPVDDDGEPLPLF